MGAEELDIAAAEDVLIPATDREPVDGFVVVPKPVAARGHKNVDGNSREPA